MNKNTFLLISLLFAGLTAFSQDKIQRKPQKRVAIKTVKTKDIQIRSSKDLEYKIFGNFEVTKYDILSRKTAAAKELNALIGSLVKVNESSITGQLIDPMTFEIFEITEMNSSDYIYRAFGREIKAKEPNLPKTVQVHKIDHEECYGIINLGNQGIAIPYKGVLLFLERK